MPHPGATGAQGEAVSCLLCGCCVSSATVRASPCKGKGTDPQAPLCVHPPSPLVLVIDKSAGPVRTCSSSDCAVRSAQCGGGGGGGGGGSGSSSRRRHRRCG
jgi:hypothetical protein